ncbi:MAG: helix-turn-helix domain-containing protein [Christensenellales bacterium]|jgi:transposase
MRTKRFPVRLTEEEVAHLQTVVGETNERSHAHKRANILLRLDENRNANVRIADVAAELQVSSITVCNTARRYAEMGLARTLKPKPSQARRAQIKINAPVQAQILTIANSPPPKGRAKWTLLMIRDELIEKQVVDSISPEGVRQVLKKRQAMLRE